MHGKGKQLWWRRSPFILGVVVTIATLLLAPGAATVMAKPAHASVTLTIWSPENRPDDATAHTWLIKQFEATHPGITVNLTTTTWDDHITRLEAAKTAGNLPDIIYTWSPNTAALYAQGITQDIGDVVKHLSTHNFPSGELAQLRTNTGGYMAIPFIGYLHVFFYRTDYFKQAHVSPPKTWSQYLADARKLTTDGHKGVCLYSRGLDSYYTLDFMIAGGVQLENSQGKITVNSPETVKALQMIKTINDHHWSPSGWNAWNMDDAKLPFLANQCAMEINSTSFLNELQTKDPQLLSKVGTFAIPRDAKGKYAGWAGASEYAMSATTTHRAAAKAFLEFMFSKRTYEGFIGREVLGFMPMYKPAQTDNAFYQQSRIRPLVKAYKGGIKAAAKGGPLLGASHDPTLGSQVYNEQLYNLMANRILNGQSPAAVAKWAAEQVARIKASGH